MTFSRHKPLLPLAALALVSACTIGPTYHRPAVEAPAAYKEAGNWTPAHPADLDHGRWWSLYNDKQLNDLEGQVAISNQSLKAAAAAYREAVATVQEARAGYYPTVDLGGAAQRAKSHGISGSGGAVGNSFSATTDASWAPDLWGRIRQTVEAQKATAEASAADLADATLSTQATLAVDYFELRAADQQKRLLDATVAADKKSLQIASNQYKAGVVSKADVAQAQTQVDTVRAAAINTGVERAALEHAIAVLVGKAPANFTLKPAGDLRDAPVDPPGIPSELLQRRPDIASAERQVAAANANIGVAETAYFPDVTLTASEGFASAILGKLISAPSNAWAIGAAVTETVFDGWFRAAKVKEARATFDQQVALYRQAVLTAFQQVEDDLAALRILAQQEKVQASAVKSSQEAARLIANQYKAGAVDYTSVVTAQIQELQDKESMLGIRENRIVASVQLVEALGGGWDGNLGGKPQPPIALKSAPVKK